MSGQALSSKQPVAARYSDEEWQMRVDLAACYRLFHLYRMTDLIYNHISARVPGNEEHFLINPYGLMYDEITASSLVKVDVDGNVLDDTTGLGINPGGFTIHSAVHMAREDIVCVMHTHTLAGIAVSVQKDGLLPITQQAMRFTDNLAYHNYEGVHFTDDERRKLQASLGDRKAMILRNHGLLVAGSSIPDAFDLIYYLEHACQAQVAALSCGVELVHPDRSVALQVAGAFVDPNRKANAKIWPALMRKLDRESPGYDQ